MTFAAPTWLVAGLPACLALLWLYYRFDARQRAALATFASGHLLGQLTASFSKPRRTFKRVLFVAGVACIFAALARPQWGFRWEEMHRKGIDILFAVDTSKSMLAEDVKPNRITRAKLAVTDLVNKLDGDRVGLIAFAGDAFLQAPLTLDYDAFRQSLDALDVGVVPRGGTNVATAIREAVAAFGNETKNQKILVLITDGEDLEAKGIDAARAAAKDGLKVYTIGVGGTAGELIPVPDDSGGGTTFLKDESGQYVKSRLDESTLGQIAGATGAIYAPLGQQGQGMETVYLHALAPLPKQDVMSRLEKVNIERFQWPLALGSALLLAEMFVGTRKGRFGRRKFSPVPARATRMSLRQAVTALVLVALCLAAQVQASPQGAERAYKKGDYTTAENQYQQAATKEPGTAALQFNLGAAAYKNGRFDKAGPAFQKTLATDKLEVQQQAYYNLGNTQYRVGQKSEQTQPQETIKTWQGALASYGGALKLNPADADAKFNRDFVQRKLDALQKQQQKQDSKDQQSKDQQSKDQQSKDQQSKDQQSKDQQSKDQGSKDQQSKDQQSKDQQSKDQQSKDQQSKDQQSKDEQSKDQQSKDQQSKDQGSKDQQSKNDNQAPQPDKDQNGQDKKPTQEAKNDQKPQPTPGEAKPDQSPAPENGQSEQDTSAQPGEMTPREAKALLDSVKKDEHVLPTAPDSRNTVQGQQEQPAKDW